MTFIYIAIGVSVIEVAYIDNPPKPNEIMVRFGLFMSFQIYS